MQRNLEQELLLIQELTAAVVTCISTAQGQASEVSNSCVEVGGTPTPPDLAEWILAVDRCCGKGSHFSSRCDHWRVACTSVINSPAEGIWVALIGLNELSFFKGATRETAQWLRALASVIQDLGSVPRHRVVHNHL